MNTASRFPCIGLFKPKSLDQLQESTLSYEATFFPFHYLKDRHKLAWVKTVKITKAKLLAACSEDLTRVLIPAKLSTGGAKEWPLCWAFNCQPTETEWNRITPESTFLLELRVSGLIPDGGTRAVIVPLQVRYS